MVISLQVNVKVPSLEMGTAGPAGGHAAGPAVVEDVVDRVVVDRVVAVEDRGIFLGGQWESESLLDESELFDVPFQSESDISESSEMASSG